MSAPAWSLIALVYHLASRLGYVLYIGRALRRQERTRHFSERYGPEPGFRRFRRRAAALMYNDAASFVLLCLATWGTLSVALPRALVVTTGAVFVIVGTSIKLWAAATLGGGAYYWRNFFAPSDWDGPSTAGPYRFFKNPMYTVGYLPTYGFALITGSLVGLAAAVVDHVAILAFYRLVEKPHFEKHAGGGSGKTEAQSAGER